MIKKIEPLVEIFNEFGYQNISKYVSSIRIQNSVDTPVGVMNLVINPSATSSLPTSIIHNAILNEAQRKLKLNSIISAKIDKNAQDHSFLGRIDNIFPRISADGNSTRRELVLNCSMLLPKLLLKDDIINAPLLQELPEVKKVLGSDRLQFLGWSRGVKKEGGGNYFAGKPEDAIKFILENCVATNTTSVVGRTQGGNLIAKSFFDPKKAETFKFTFLEGETLFNPQLATYSGSILQYIYECIDPDFYEIFFDTQSGSDGLAYNTFTIRPKPFSFSDYVPQHNDSQSYRVVRGWLNFDELDSVTKTSEQRLSDQTGISDFELKNSFSCNFLLSLVASANSYLGHFGMQYPIVNLKSVQKYGWRHKSLVSKLINFDLTKAKYNEKIESKTDFNDIAKELADENGGWGKELDYQFDKREAGVEWYSFPHFESGTIQWTGDENLRIGKKLIYEDKEYLDPDEEKIYKGVEYYIRSVTHDFAYGRFFKTTTEVTRGAPKGLVAKWLNKNRADFTGPTPKDYQAKINQTVTIDKVELAAIDDVRSQWREITEL
ncbi:MAG: hypothetical protein RDU14_16755 [Melioribacteraceae bacterium]|nr:hypothetical protein [Melioribacteraceae bacterium]